MWFFVFMRFSVVSEWWIDHACCACPFRVCAWCVSVCKNVAHGESSKMFLFFRLLEVGSALSPKGGEHNYPPYRCPAGPCGPVAERVCGSRGNSGGFYGLYMLLVI